MLLAHLSDLHLGHRAFGRAERGRNVREGDVAAAFQRAVQEIIRLKPDLILMVGDIFDRPDPPPGALVALARGLEAFRTALPDTQVFMVAGARDTPRRAGDPGALAAMDPFPQVEAVAGAARSVFLREMGVHLYLVPHRAVVRRPYPQLRGHPEARWNVLLAHAGVGPEAGPGLPLDTGPWDYVALGYLHLHQQVAPRAFYPGSLERVGPEPWREAAEEKGFLTFDLEGGRSRFHPIPVRPVVSLAPIRIPPGRSELLPEKLPEVLGEVPGGIEGKIVRLRIEGLSPGEVQREDRGLFASLREKALHLAIEVDDFQDLLEENPLPFTSRDRGFALRALGTRIRKEEERAEEILRLLEETGRAEGGEAGRTREPEVEEAGLEERLLLRELRGSALPVLERIRMEAGEGLQAWVGADGRTLNAFVSSLLWGLGLSREAPGPRQGVSGGGVPEQPSLSLRLGGGEGDVWLGVEGEGEEGAVGGNGRDGPRWRLPPEGLALAWAGAGGERVENLLRGGADLLAEARGVDALDDLRGELARRFPSLAEEEEGDLSTRDLDRLRLESELEDLEAQLRSLSEVPEEVNRLEGELRDLRERAAELRGDLEAASMEWHRERQDAQTNLQTYRDRGREVRDRIEKLKTLGPESACPTCGRLLGDTAGEVLEELEEEWERLVQDGRWWRRRWEQLEAKPRELREMEGRFLRLNARVEDSTERLERARSDLREMDELRHRSRDVETRLELHRTGEGREPRHEGTPEPARSLMDLAAGLREEILVECRTRLLHRGGRRLNRLTGGRILGLDLGGGDEVVVQVVDGRGSSGVEADEDRAAATVALRMALVELLAEDWSPLGSFILGDPFDRMGEEDQLRALALLRRILSRIPQVFLLTRGAVVERASEFFDGLYEFRGDGEGDTPSLQALPAGVGILNLR
jgi:DNA repair exonuclease SbcCD nuclease subunit